jgi:geranylgeranyl pyrophosphate synthase
MDLPLMTHMPENAPWREISPFRRIDASLGRVSALIHRSLDTRDSQRDLASFVDHLRACNGKMLRPGMVLLAGECFGALTEEHVRVSAMLEMIHHATLLHDDVIDEGRKRRGVPTANSLWGNECARNSCIWWFHCWRHPHRPGSRARPRRRPNRQ